MDLNISNNLFLGLQEIKHLKQSLKEGGYERVLKQMISSYGIIRPFASESFTQLQVIDSGLGQLTIKAGRAIDSNVDVIEITNDLIDEILIPDDNVKRYVKIKFSDTAVEKGKVNIQADGSIVGIGTEMISRLRGLPNFPSKIIFPNSTVNTQEYTIQAVQSDTIASLNVAGGQIVAEDDQEYAVVGTFTPGISVPTQDKYPFVGDGYEITLGLSDTVVDGIEFLLAEVQYDGVDTVIIDRRISNVFNFLTKGIDSLNTITTVSDIIACTEVKYKLTSGSTESSIAKIEWGLKSDSWSMDQSSRNLTLFAGKGGTWDTLADFTDGDFVGQYATFNEGQSCLILNSVQSGSNVVFELEFQESYITTGTVVIAPIGILELQIKHKTKNFFYKHYAASFVGEALVELTSGSYIVTHRFIHNNEVSKLVAIKNNDYLNESSFNSNGFVNTGSESYTTSTLGEIVIQQDEPSNIFTLLDQIVFAGVVWDYVGSLSNIPNGWVLCDGAPISDPNSIFDGTNAPDLRAKVTVGIHPDESDYDSVGNEGGADSIVLVEDQLPEHTHAVIDQGHNHTTNARPGTNNGDQAKNAGGEGNDDTLKITGGLSPNRTTSNQTSNITIGNTGGNQSIDVRQRFSVTHKIMKL